MLGGWGRTHHHLKVFTRAIDSLAYALQGRAVAAARLGQHHLAIDRAMEHYLTEAGALVFIDVGGDSPADWRTAGDRLELQDLTVASNADVPQAGNDVF